MKHTKWKRRDSENFEYAEDNQKMEVDAQTE